MTCQTTCQDEEFEQSEYELRVDCEGSCSGDGALFCDGEYILSADEIPDCVRALVARGDIDVDVDVDATVEANASGGGCAMTGRAASPQNVLAMLFVAGLVAYRRRRARTL
jgi:MYXO-CTERM domain-containing protein